MSPYITLFQKPASTVSVRNHFTSQFWTVLEVFITAVIPVTVQNPLTRRADTDVPLHPSYKGKVLFKNTFDGQLAATDYPKVNVCFSLCSALNFSQLSIKFYFAMFITYTAFGLLWAWFCYRHIHELLPIQVSFNSQLC